MCESSQSPQNSRQSFPKLVYTMSKDLVFTKLVSMNCVAVSLDLCMSRGCLDIFDIVVHGLDKFFRTHTFHLKMIQYVSTTEAALAYILESVLMEFRIQDEVVSCVKDGGSNFKRFMFTCKPLEMTNCYESMCIGHILGNAAKAATTQDIYQCFT